ncbi:glycerophosphocholine cholinephosphodiesterase ENPP6-like [Macrobrachium rosenbergii]|uniref:glycerophosphocholine cholinephosphodiesterase ENPP6-like n=1 Tax=Macrobrachium rosenbergii TaxID=79674 RepID=UPI0034D62D58
MGLPLRAICILWAMISLALIPGCSSLPNAMEAEQEEDHIHIDDRPKLLFILLDGFRWDYVDKQRPEDLPGFTRLLKEGVKAKWTQPVFPTMSFPAWTTLFTGLYAENHGIVGSSFYDPETKDIFTISDLDTTAKTKWWTSEPIWTTAERAGLKTAQYLISRCDISYDNILTHHCEPYTRDAKKDVFLRNAMKALEKFDQGYNLVQVFTSRIDDVGHAYGPGSNEVQQAVRAVDNVIDILLDELDERELADKVNVVVVSDHGMADTSEEAVKRHDIDTYLDPAHVENIAEFGSFMNIKATEGNAEKVFDALKSIPGISVYKKEDIPETFHYKNGDFVHDVILVADAGNYIMASTSDKQIPRAPKKILLGSHGYNTDVQTMRGIFFARGPAFVEGTVIERIHMVDVYQVLTNVLEIVPKPNNGTWARVESAFRSAYRHPKQSNGASASLLASVSISLLTLTLARFI